MAGFCSRWGSSQPVHINGLVMFSNNLLIMCRTITMLSMYSKYDSNTYTVYDRLFLQRMLDVCMQAEGDGSHAFSPRYCGSRDCVVCVSHGTNDTVSAGNRDEYFALTFLYATCFREIGVTEQLEISL
jgi:hypothetical protein